jgi:hypothetical protein
MPIRDILGHIGENYGAAKAQGFARHPLAAFIRGTAAREIETALGENGTGLLVVGSAGAGNWAEVPWVSVFDSVVTDSATRGYYVVYLFHSSAPLVHLSLNQGTTAVRDEFGARARDILADRAAFIRKRVPDFSDRICQSNKSNLARLHGYRGITRPVTRWGSRTILQPFQRKWCSVLTYKLQCNAIAPLHFEAASMQAWRRCHRMAMNFQQMSL